MPKYAQYDPATAAPAPVLGWWDTDSFRHVALPPLTDLLALTEAQWEAHFAGNWAVSGGTLTLRTPPAPSPPTANSAVPSMAELMEELATLRAQVGQLHIS